LPLDEKSTLHRQAELQQRISGSTDQIYWQLKELDGNIFEYYAMIDARQLEEDEANKPDQYLRASRNIMNATMNLKEIHTDLDDFEISDRPFLNEQRLNFQNRLLELFKDLDDILSKHEAVPPDALDQVLANVDEHDTRCIRDSSKAIKAQDLTDQEATSVVMTNRLFTQSCRMFVYSMRSLFHNAP
jgi:phosphate:Na+ symporter